MKIRLIITILITGFLTVLTSCENEDPIPEDKINTSELEVGWNGFIMDETEYATPNAIIEIWGETDSLSSDFDIYFTDGTFNPQIRAVSDYSLLIYFDANSPSLDELSTGVYYFENTPERLPNKIVEAYIEIINDTSIDRYQIIEGTVEVSENDGYFLLEYLLKTVKDQEIIDVVGQYTGLFQLIDQRI
ncbi:MAG: hypothetical protein KAS71_10170 [Bacteroidales bacterium]|nr:hypothetical protein [Bacteroidales bacterium]